MYKKDLNLIKILSGFVIAFSATLLLRLFCISPYSLQTDEIAAVLISRRPILEIIWTIAVQDVGPPLYYLLLHFWIALTGTDDSVLKIL